MCPDDDGLSRSDHDLLITIAERVANVRSDVADVRGDIAGLRAEMHKSVSEAKSEAKIAATDLELRLKTLERRSSDTDGRNVTSEGPLAQRWNATADTVDRRELKVREFDRNYTRWNKAADWHEGWAKFTWLLVPCAFALVVELLPRFLGWGK